VEVIIETRGEVVHEGIIDLEVVVADTEETIITAVEEVILTHRARTALGVVEVIIETRGRIDVEGMDRITITTPTAPTASGITKTAPLRKAVPINENMSHELPKLLGVLNRRMFHSNSND